MEYLFTSKRLGFRNWHDADVAVMAMINADPEVMQYFPSIKTYAETADFVKRMQKEYTDKGYCYFAVETLADKKLIGFVGISEQTFESDFTPFTDIGWRLAKSAWGNGYATEGAKQCLEYAFDVLNIYEVNAIAPVVNLPSISVMKKIGMKEIIDFEHPLLIDNIRLKKCLLYRKVKS